MNVLFFCQDDSKVEPLALALRIRWPDLRTLIVSQGKVGLQMIEELEPDLVMLCGDLSDLGIWSAIEEIRGLSDVPLIVAVEAHGEMEVVKALELGADEHIRMPCNLMEVTARVVALMRRISRSGQRSDGSPLQCGELLINPDTREVFLGADRIQLTPTEFKLLFLLAKNRHVTLPQGFIQRVIWSDDVEAGQAPKKYIQRLRRKLGDDARDPVWIKTVHGVGYRLSTPISNAA